MCGKAQAFILLFFQSCSCTMKQVVVISIALCLASQMFAQADDSARYSQYQVIAKGTNSSPNIGSVKISLPLQGGASLADVLAQNSALFIKYYGPSSLATLSVRGMGAQHTAIMWNGVNLQSAMNGVIDLNLLPSFFIDQAILETGANASANGSGAIAGAVHLSNKPTRKKIIFGDLQAGSFGNRSAGLGATFYKGKFILVSRAYYRQARNDYEFSNYFKPGKPTERIENSKLSQQGAMQEVSYKINKQHNLYLNAWYLQTDRQLPPAMGAAANNHERQYDASIKSILRHEGQLSEKLFVVNRLVYFREQIDYYNDLYKPSLSHAKSIIGESEYRLKLPKNFDFTGLINYTQQQAITDGYEQGRSRTMTSIWVRLGWKSVNEVYKFSLGNRQTLLNGSIVPSSPDFAMDIRLLKPLHLKGNAAYSFRIPSINDLYWLQGGNPNLKPEQGVKSELSLEYSTNAVKAAVTTFYQRLDNWIMWQPSASVSYWSAMNARQVESKGVELAGEYQAQWGQHHLVFAARYQYVQSINTKVDSTNENNLGKQLFYTPLHTGLARVTYGYRNFRIFILGNYTGMRFLTGDNNPDYVLDGYMLFNTGLIYDFNYKEHRGSLQFAVNNIGNKVYQVVENRPMPLRNYQLTLKFNINYE